MAALEANLMAVDHETSERFGDMEQRLPGAHRRVDEVRAHVDRLQQQQQEARHEELRPLPWQWIGTALFAVGALLAMSSDLAC